MHASAIVRTVGKFFENMDHVESVMPMLERLGASHASLGVKPEFFGVRALGGGREGLLYGVCSIEASVKFSVKLTEALYVMSLGPSSSP